MVPRSRMARVPGSSAGPQGSPRARAGHVRIGVLAKGITLPVGIITRRGRGPGQADKQIRFIRRRIFYESTFQLFSLGKLFIPFNFLIKRNYVC